MKPENHAWEALRQHAAAQLRTGFATRVLSAARGPQADAWQQLQARAAAQLRPGFAERVLRAARNVADVPSLASQFALSAATAALCLGAVLFYQDRLAKQADAQNLAAWRQIVATADDLDNGGL